MIHSLALKIGAIIILVEILTLSLTGGFYINRFHNEIDRRFESSIKIPGFLMAEGVLNYSLTANRQRMESLVGHELENAILFGVVQQVFYAMNPEHSGKHVADIPGLNPAWFDPQKTTEPFRADLFFRLRAFTIELPPLRERLADIRELTMHHLARICTQNGQEIKGVSPDCIEALESYSWPGNVRELVNTLERVIAAEPQASVLYPQHLPIPSHQCRPKKGE